MLVLLLVELLDELAGGAREAAWPFLRQDLGLSYVQVGLLLGLPAVLSGVLDPLVGVLSDLGRRRLLVVAGGVLFAASLFLTAASRDFWMLLASFVLFYPASGAFVNLSQAELMDHQAGRRDQNMARWTLAGSAGALVGPMLLGGLAGVGFGWRGLYAAIGGASALALVLAARVAFPRRASVEPARRPADAVAVHGAAEAHPLFSVRGVARDVARALSTAAVVRWLVLLELSNLMLDVLFGFLALYFVDVSGVSAAQAALATAVWSAAQLAGDFLVIPLLERADGVAYVRWSAALALIAWPGFLLAGPLAVKLALIGVVGLLRSGWYAVLTARLYEALPGRSGLAVGVATVAASAGSLVPVILGALAQAAGLRAAMWVLLAAPLALVLGLPRRKRRQRYSPLGM